MAGDVARFDGFEVGGGSHGASLCRSAA
jgi:hypothetical protein